jgi:CDP-glucose 4,6-dehydratase
LTSNRTVAEVVEAILKRVPGHWEDRSDPSAHHEASKLNLSTDKAFHMLGWTPTWDFDETIAKTVAWYTDAKAAVNAHSLTIEQIRQYETDAQRSSKPWCTP